METDRNFLSVIHDEHGTAKLYHSKVPGCCIRNPIVIIDEDPNDTAVAFVSEPKFPGLPLKKWSAFEDEIEEEVRDWKRRKVEEVDQEEVEKRQDLSDEKFEEFVSQFKFKKQSVFKN
jgi:hypothetical protein